MHEIKIVKEFFSKLCCTRCSVNFSHESVSVVRQEENYTVVRILCSNCGKHIGLAMLGLDRNDMEKSIEFDKDGEACPIANSADDTPISYDDVIEAHDFFNTLGDDWIKHIPKNNE